MLKRQSAGEAGLARVQGGIAEFETLTLLGRVGGHADISDILQWDAGLLLKGKVAIV